MKNPYTKKSIAEDVKREVLTELNFGNHQQHSFIDGIKREVLMELDQFRYGQPPHSSKAFVEAVKNEVLAGIQSQPYFNQGFNSDHQYPNRTTIESIKRDVIAQIEAGQEPQEETGEQEMRNFPEHHHYGRFDPKLIQAIKDSVLAEMNMPNYR
ncbi:MAG: hypothetical protein WDA53_02640 [Bacillota bacterium]